MSNVSLTAPTDYQTEAERISRQRKLAEALQTDAMAPAQGQMAGGWYVQPSWTQHLAKLLNAHNSRSMQDRSDTEQKTLASQYQGAQSGDVQRLIEALRGRPAQTIQPDPQEAQQAADYGTPEVQPVNIPAMDATASLQAALPGMQTPMGQQLATTYLMEQLKPKELFDKVSPKDYTPESIAAYQQTKNPAVLVPVRKLETVTAKGPNGEPVTQFVDTHKPQAPIAQPVKLDMVGLGGTTQPVNPYTQTGPLAHTETPDAKLSASTTRRGQDMTNDRAIDANAIASDNKNIAQTESIRKEFNSLPEVKNYKEVLPIIESARRAPNTPAGDIDIIYATGKIMDPNSVVREGELNLVIKAGSPAQRLQGYLSYVQGGGRLSAGQRAELNQIMESRVGALQNNYDAARKAYTGMVTSQKLDPRQIFADLPSNVIVNPGANQPFAGGAKVVSWNDLGR